MAEALLCPLTVALSSVLTLSWLERHGAARPERSLESVAVIMRGDHVERELWDELSDELAHMSAEHAVSPHLIFLTATETARGYASRERSVLARELPGLLTSERQLPASIRTDALLHIVRTLNADPTVQAISIHLPLPSAVDAPRVFAALCAEKDAQGLGALNYRELCLKLGRPIAVPPIAAAVLEALRRGTVALEGRRAVVLGRSSTVGGPIAQLLMRSNATVTVVTSFTPAADVPAIVRSADVLVATTNVPNSVRGAWLKRGVAVIDVGKGGAGSERAPTGTPKLGDVRLDEAMTVASFVAPSPNGVERLLLPMLARNVLDCTRASLDELLPELIEQPSAAGSHSFSSPLASPEWKFRQRLEVGRAESGADCT